jgi:GNAT superfamily N-acetyltransferase
MASPTIRLREDGELETCAAVLVAVHEADGYPVEGVADPVAWLLPTGLREAWVAELDGQVVGHIGLAHPGPGDEAARIWAQRSTGEEIGVLCRLFVLPSARGHALGRKLIHTATEHATAMGLRIVGDVMAKDEIAIHLYETLG